MSYSSALVELLNKPDANQIDLLNGCTYPIEYESFTRQQLLGHSQYAVWKFTHKTTGKELAAKVVPLRKNRNKRKNRKKRDLDPANYYHLMKIMHEIEILRILRNHNNIIQFYGYGVDKESALLCMELMDYSLQDLLTRQRTSKHEWTVKSYSDFFYLITTSCLSALEFCFNMGIRNNDIKPANILLNKKGQVKISDFGEASKFGESQNFGTLLYRPHLCDNSQSNLKESENDLWGLGITLLEIAYGQNPILIYNPYKNSKNELVGLIDFLKNLNSEILLSYLNGLDELFEHSFEDFPNDYDFADTSTDLFHDSFFVDFFRKFIKKCWSNQTSKQIIKHLSDILINYVRKYRSTYGNNPLETNVIKYLEDDYEHEFDPMINKMKFPDDNTIYSFDLSDFEFSKNVNLWGHFCAKHINTKKTLFFKRYSAYYKIETESYIYHNLSSHPSIVEYYGYGKSISGYFIVLELHNINLGVLGGIFNAWKINFQEQFLMNIIVSIIKALEYIHSNGFYKFKFKPTHILFFRNGVFKLSIFDYSLRYFQTENGSILWNYSPILQHEKIFSNKRDKQYHNDIWKFGMVILEVAYKEKNYEFSQEVYKKNNDATYEEIGNEFTEEAKKSLKARYSENLVNFISFCLEKREEKRSDCQSLMKTSFYQECLIEFERNQNILAQFLDEILIASEEKFGTQILIGDNYEDDFEMEDEDDFEIKYEDKFESSIKKQLNSQIISQETWNQLGHSYNIIPYIFAKD